MGDFINTSEVEPPAGLRISHTRGECGNKIRYGLLPARVPRGTVLLLTGYSELIEKYVEVLNELHERNLNVAIFDWAGQGLSDPPESWENYFDHIERDLETFYNHCLVKEFDAPYFLLAHSMGSLPSLSLLSNGFDGFERAMLTAPLTRLFSGVKDFTFRCAVEIACRLRFGNQRAPVKRRAHEFDGNMFTSDKRRFERFGGIIEAASSDIVHVPRLYWLQSLLQYGHKLRKPDALSELKTPILICAAGDERRVDQSDYRLFAEASDFVDLQSIEYAKHEIMMEQDVYRKEFWRLFDNFFDPALAEDKTPTKD